MPSWEGKFAFRVDVSVRPEGRLMILICIASMGDLTKPWIDANRALL